MQNRVGKLGLYNLNLDNCPVEFFCLTCVNPLFIPILFSLEMKL